MIDVANMGRPALPPDERMNTQVGVRMTAEERKAIEEAARNAEQRLSDWCRQKLVAAAKRARKS